MNKRVEKKKCEVFDRHEQKAICLQADGRFLKHILHIAIKKMLLLVIFIINYFYDIILHFLHSIVF